MKLLPLLAYSKKRPTMKRRMQALEETLNAIGASIEFTPENEDINPYDQLEDEQAKMVCDEYERGNVFAWFCAKVQVKYRDIEATDYLGCCSYKSEQEFKTDPYYYDMVNTCIEEVNRDVNAHNADVQKRWNIRKAKSLVRPYGIILVQQGKETYQTI